MADPASVSLADLFAARDRLRSVLTPTPLVRLDAETAGQVWLKLENLQPIGSFKLRGAGNAMLAAGAAIRHGVVTVSAGNMAQGLAWWARRLGIRATAVVPEGAQAAKTEAARRLGARVVVTPYDQWWALLEGRKLAGERGVFVHPVADVQVIAGNGTIALELAQALPRLDTVLVPWGGGGLACGIAAGLTQLRPGARVIGCEVETAIPLTASLAAGAPCTVPHTSSFVDGIGGKSVLPAMWPLARRVIAGSAVVALTAVRRAIRLLVERHRVVAEGAGAASVAAALAGHADGVTVCVVSGGNIGPAVLADILTDPAPTEP